MSFEEVVYETDGYVATVTLSRPGKLNAWTLRMSQEVREAMRQAAVQLAVYRLAWAALSGCPRSSVRTAFHYVRTGLTVVPDELPDPTELAGMLADSEDERQVAV